MASIAERKWQYAQRLEQELLVRLKGKDPLFEDVQSFIHSFRNACQDSIFLDFTYAAAQKVERNLWNTHIAIKSRYRKILARFKTEERRKHVVEKRKWEQRYVDFLKTSQYFYKGYIQRLASHFDDLTDLRKIAHMLDLNILSADDRVQVSEETKRLVLLSCHATLLRLGDLSRYRNEIRTKDRSWDTAMSYYRLANDLYPMSGNAFNQMAVISIAEGQHLNGIYQLYRALAISEPYADAEGNLELEFRKIEKERASGSRRSVPNKTNSAGAAGPLISWFILLHAELYKGEEFSGHDELENEVLGQMTVLLKEQSLEEILDKFVLINVSAEYLAGERFNKLSDHSILAEHQLRSHNLFLRLNVRMLFMLLQLLQPELAGPRDDVDAPDVTGRENETNTESITAVMRRILPALRHYSTWLGARIEAICDQEGHTSLTIHIKEMWSMYCSTMSLLIAAFPPENLDGIEYLLEEDMATVGLKPFRDSKLCTLYVDNGHLKPRSTDPNIERSHPNLEMRARLKDLLEDAVRLAQTKNKNGKKITPIYFIDRKFYFREEGLPMNPMSGQSADAVPPSSLSQHSAYVALDEEFEPLLDDEAPPSPSVAPSDSHQSMSTDMYRMVDELVTPVAGQKSHYPQGSNDTSYGMHSLTAAEVFAPLNLSARPASRQNASPTLFPRLPGIYNSPFSPQPGELQAASPDHPKTATMLSSLQLSYGDQEAVVNSQGQPTGHNHGQRSSWGNNSTPSSSLPTYTPQQSVSQQLHQSLSQQYNPPSSTTFSHPSSLYSGTPMRQLGGGRPSRNQSYNESTSYGGATDFELNAMLQSSIWDGSQRGWAGSVQTPPNGQGQGQG